MGRPRKNKHKLLNKRILLEGSIMVLASIMSTQKEIIQVPAAGIWGGPNHS